MFIDTIFSSEISQPSTSRSRAHRGAWHLALVLSLGLVSAGLVGCGDDDAKSGGTADNDGIEIAGVFDSEYDTLETITDETWTVASEEFGTTTSSIALYDNANNFAITHNPEDAAYNAGKFNKIVWTEPEANGSFYYCAAALGLDTAAEAQTSGDTPDDSDPSTGGCMNFPWTRLFVAPAQ